MQSKPPRTLIRNKEIMMMMMMMVMIMIIIIIMAVQSKPPHTLIRNKDLMMTMMMMILMTKMMTIMMTMMKITLKNTLQHIPPRSPCECTSSRLQRARWEKTSYSFKFYFTLSLHYCLNSCSIFVCHCQEQHRWTTSPLLLLLNQLLRRGLFSFTTKTL